MENKEWIISLSPGADGVHVPKPAPEVKAAKRRTADADDFEEKENCTPKVHRRTKKAKTEQGVLKGRPLLQDVVNDVL